MDPFKKTVEDELGVKLLSVMYLGRRHVNLRFPRSEKRNDTGRSCWCEPPYAGHRRVAVSRKGTRISDPFAFNEVYTALASGAVDGQDNPLPTVVDKKFYEVTKQISLTSHLVDLITSRFQRKHGTD